MAAPPSSYGERPPLQGWRRSFTAPSRQLSLHERAGLDKSDADAEILYSHPNARIIAFSPPTDAIQSQSKETLPDADYPIDAVEILPWRSRNETLYSSGAIKIEKVRGSSHFLKSADQKVIQGLMRNSQCWCVDGESKFVLRTGQLKYYRIELPSEAEEDKQKVEEFKAALGKVLRFERTPCPFKRGFHVDLPDDAITPRRKGTWKRRQPLQPTTPNTDPLPLRRTKNSRAWSFQAKNDSSPLQPSDRRGSDYGLTASRDSSRSRPEATEYRSSTPSSIISSEDAYETRQEDGSGDDNVQEDDVSDQQQADGSSVDGMESETPMTASEQTDLDDEHMKGQEAQPDEEEAPLSAQTTQALAVEMEEDQNASLQLQEDDLVSSIPEDSEPASQSPQDRHDEVSVEHEAVVEESPEPELEGNVDEKEELSPVPSLEEPAEGPTPSIVQPHSAQASETSTEDPAKRSTETILAEPPESQVGAEDTVQAEHVPDERDDDNLSRVSSVDSFHTTDSLAGDMLDDQVHTIDFERAPHGEGFTPFFLSKPGHQRGLSEMTVTASTDASEPSPTKQRPSTSDSTPGLATSSMSDSSWPEVHTPPSSPINQNLRRRLLAKRSLSPLPPSTTIYSPNTSPANHGSPFTAGFLQKAAGVALVKPIEAVVLLVHILARIAGGATLNDLFSGDLFRRPNDRETGTHRRRTSFPDQNPSPRDDSDEDEDDFGVPIRGRTKSAESPTKVQGKKVEKEDDQNSIFDLD